MIISLAVIPLATRAADATVNIQGFAFSPAEITINVGDTVTWVQKDSTRHTTTSDAGVWDSGLLSQNGTFSFTFTSPGTYPYHCSPHSFMTGTVTVNGAANVPPVVSISVPANDTVINLGDVLSVTVTASDSDGSITQVELLDGAASLGTIGAAPYIFSISNLTQGAHQLTAKATDNSGATTVSEIVIIEVTTANTNPPPALRIISVSNNGEMITIQWEGGTAPYLLQKMDALTDTNWENVLTTSNLQVSVPHNEEAGFYRVQDHAQTNLMAFTVLLNGNSEVTPKTTAGVGSGLLIYDGQQLSYEIYFSGLSTNATVAHVHGPADLTQTANPIFTLNGASGTAGVLSGTQALTDEQLQMMLAGNTYVNIHTSLNPSGEIRGQVVPVH